MKRDFLKITDLSPAEMEALLKRAIRLKAGDDRNKCPLIGRSIGLLFEKTSTRTRVSFETGIYQLGAQTVYMNANEIQLGRGESVADTAKILSRYLDAIAIRTFAHARAEDFARNSRVPVINALTDMHHPCQALADVMTVLERKDTLRGLTLAYIGDGNNVANSLIEAAGMTGMNIVIACPVGYDPDPTMVKAHGARIVRDPMDAARGADVLYTDVWVSMGMEAETARRRLDFKGYQINAELIARANKDAIVMHCLPAHRGDEITDDALDGPHSVVLDQAENRLHAQKALLEFLLT